MKCIGCAESAEGYAVIPGVGELGEIRFYCDGCARRDRVKMRYWDGRDLDIGGYREDPSLGKSFSTLVFSFEDVARMRVEDLALLLDWVDDHEIAGALVGAAPGVQNRIYSALGHNRARRVREMVASGRGTKDPEAARESIIQTVRRL